MELDLNIGQLDEDTYIFRMPACTILIDAVFSGEPEPEETIIASGVSGDTLWSISDSGVMPVTGAGAMENYEGRSKMPWYDYREQVVSVVIEAGVTAIGDYAFYGMVNLKEISLPEGLLTIGDYAFKNDPRLDGVVLPAGLKRIGESAFYGCAALSEIVIPEGIYTIWGYTFKNCSALASVSLPKTLIKIDEAAFYGTALKELDIPAEVAIIGTYCFKNCTAL